MKTIAIMAVAGLAGLANANVVISEVLGSTTGSDAEFIEIYNDGAGSVDVTGWTVELWDSDSGTGFGGADGASPYAISATSLASGQTWTPGNDLAAPAFGTTFDDSLPANAIENSSYTIILADAFSNVIFSAFVTDGGAGDAANRAGASITPTITVGPDGTFLPAGYRLTAADGSYEFSNFDIGAPNDPGVANYAAAPAPASMALLGLGGLVAGRRRRA